MATTSPALPSCDPLLDEEAAADFLKLSAKTLRKWRCVGGGPVFVKLGRSVRYERSGLQQFVQERVRRSTSDTAGAAA